MLNVKTISRITVKPASSSSEFLGTTRDAFVAIPENPVSKSQSAINPNVQKSEEIFHGLVGNIAERQQRLALTRQELVSSHSNSRSVLLSKQLKPVPTQLEQENKLFVKPSRPIFMISIGFIYLSFLIGEIVYNRGFEKFSANPFGGPSSETLIYFGAQYGPLIFKRNQYYRIFTSMFIHTGVVHFLVSYLAQLRLGICLEQDYGRWKIGILYVLCSVFGSIFSVICQPKVLQVGSSGALCGLVGFSLVDLFLFWKDHLSPIKELFVLSCLIILCFGVGILPYVNNFVQVGGLAMGIFYGMTILPAFHIHFNKKKLFIMMIGASLLLSVLGISLVLLFAERSILEWCQKCSYFDCVDFGIGWCSDETLSRLFGL